MRQVAAAGDEPVVQAGCHLDRLRAEAGPKLIDRFNRLGMGIVGQRDHANGAIEQIRPSRGWAGLVVAGHRVATNKVRVCPGAKRR